MGRIRALILTLLSGAITSFLVWSLISDTGISRYTAIGGALFFGACTLVPLSFLFPARIPAEDVDGSVTVPNSTFRCFAMAIALIAITASTVMIWPTVSDDNDWRKWVFLLLPLPCAFLAFRYLHWALGGQPAFRFDSQGVTRYHWGERTTPWDAVVNVRILKINGAENVVLDVTPEHRKQSSWFSKLGGATGFGDVTLASGTSGLPTKDIETLVRRFWRPRGGAA